MLKWFVDEQIVEEQSTSENVNKIKTARNNLFIIDSQMSKRR